MVKKKVLVIGSPPSQFGGISNYVKSIMDNFNSNNYDMDFYQVNLPHYTIGPSFLTKFVYENPTDIFIYPNLYIVTSSVF